MLMVVQKICSKQKFLNSFLWYSASDDIIAADIIC